MIHAELRKIGIWEHSPAPCKRCAAPQPGWGWNTAGSRVWLAPRSLPICAPRAPPRRPSQRSLLGGPSASRHGSNSVGFGCWSGSPFAPRAMNAAWLTQNAALSRTQQPRPEGRCGSQVDGSRKVPCALAPPTRRIEEPGGGAWLTIPARTERGGGWRPWFRIHTQNEAGGGGVDTTVAPRQPRTKCRRRQLLFGCFFSQKSGDN